MTSVAVILWLACSYVAYKKMHNEPSICVRLIGAVLVGFLYAIVIFSLSTAALIVLGVLI